MKTARLFYPWLSTLGALALVAWQVGLQQGHLSLEQMPPLLHHEYALTAAAAGLLLLVVFDLWRYTAARRRWKRHLNKYQEQISELFESRRELGTKARTYSDHADKLKMFISERLLETIEYDEKFLHFKNIASEVRHNGVISYDKAQTALKRARQTCDAEHNQEYQDAADGLLYLWDLLDLSTTDNLALHVANQIYDCEELYFQSMLNDGDAEPSPFQPSFMMSQALRRALLPITEDADVLDLNGAWKCPGRYQDDKFNIHMRTDNEMLGNPNHVVLLIENLLNNALFFAQQNKYKKHYSKVAISLGFSAGEVEFRVYNRGPHIKESERDRIYQLGFSSRRIHEHHGKGLGLYFVNEIAKGFEGSVDFENIENRDDEFALGIKLENGEMETRQITVTAHEGELSCRSDDATHSQAKVCEWSFAAPIVSLEITARASRKPHLLADIPRNQGSRHLDERDSQMPRWMLELDNRKRSSTLKFVPLDVRGVQFVARFPTANARLENQG